MKPVSFNQLVFRLMCVTSNGGHKEYIFLKNSFQMKLMHSRSSANKQYIKKGLLQWLHLTAEKQVRSLKDKNSRNQKSYILQMVVSRYVVTVRGTQKQQLNVLQVEEVLMGTSPKGF